MSDRDDGRGGPAARRGGAPADERIGGRDLAVWTTRSGRALAAWVLRRVRREDADRLLWATWLIGAAVLVAATAAAGEVYESVVATEGVALLDRPALRLAVALRTPVGADLVTAYTNLGGAAVMPVLTVLVVGALTWWRRSWSAIVVVGAAAAGSVAMTIAGKAAVGRARPPLAAAVPPFEESASFPSGHALNAVVVAGILAYLLVRWQRRGWARALTVSVAAAFAVTMGLSRVYLGHHWLSDVLVAWSLGTAWLTVVVLTHRLYLTVHRRARTRHVVSHPVGRLRTGRGS